MSNKTDQIVLRNLKLSDAENIYQNVRHKDIVRWTSNIPHPYKKSMAFSFIRRTKIYIRLKKAATFGIALKESERVIGVITLKGIDLKNRNAEIGYWLGKDYWNKGYMTQAAKEIIKYGFEKLKLHRIYGKCFKANIGSRKVFEKSGMKFEGELKEDAKRFNKWQNTLVYAIINKKN